MQDKEDIELGGVENGGTCAAFDQEKASGGSCPAQIIVKKKLTVSSHRIPFLTNLNLIQRLIKM